MTKILMCAIALTTGLANTAYAELRNYYPPERIHCKVSPTQKLSCEGFNRNYLTEDTFTADFRYKDATFHFVAAAARYVDKNSESSIFFTYKDAQSRMVQLKTINGSIRPQIENPAWKKAQDGLYTCTDGYMSCGITNLPTQ